MIKDLQIKNFKAWKDTDKISLGPLTVFFGGNSSGKSSIGHFLMLLRQSVELSDRKTVLYPGNENTAVDLGIPSEMLYNHDIDEKIEFSYSWDLPEHFVIRDAINKKLYTCQSIQFSAEVTINKDTQLVEVESFSYNLKTIKNVLIQVGMEKKDKSNSKRAYQLTCERYNLVRSTGRVWDIKAPIRFYGFPDEAVAYYQNANFLQGLNMLHEKFLSSIYYLGPLRNKAKRLYQWGGINPDSVGYSGENTIPAILSAKAEDRTINYYYKGHRKPFEAVIAEMLKQIGLIEDFKITRIENRQEYDVKVRTKNSKNWVDIPDVGFGVSQVLPVIVQLFYVPSGSTIIMEQPELHLHPSAQANLADIMITAIAARENYDNRNIQLIIETHSEHFLRRLQRRIAEGQISHDTVHAYFANSDTIPAELEPLQVDLFGNILNWPVGFFGDISGDIYAQTEATIQRRLKEREGV